MTNTITRSDNYPKSSNANKGFASMDKNEVREIASKGGKASHGANNHSSNDNNPSNSNKGFASMDKNEVREIASKGGKASHASSPTDHDDHADMNDNEDNDTPKGERRKEKKEYYFEDNKSNTRN